MIILFCSEPFGGKVVDPDFADEHNAAIEFGFDIGLINFEKLTGQDDAGRLFQVLPQCPVLTSGVYRGWMLKPKQYEVLYQSLMERNILLINTPEEYRCCHYLPESYPFIRNYTPNTVWLSSGLIDYPSAGIDLLLDVFGTSPVVLKDYVKSRKHEWHEACFIPDASDRILAHQVIKRFLVLQGDDLNEGIVLREFINLTPLTKHSLSGMPLSMEYRIFIINHEPLISIRYWTEGDYGNTIPNLPFLHEVAQVIPSSFCTLDVAQMADGQWLIMETGDGQVSGLQGDYNVKPFYHALRNACIKNERA